MTDLVGSTVHELLAQILARYGSIDVFIARLHVLSATPTAASRDFSRHWPSWAD
ncbi:hypothetical protein ACFWWS_36260 [Streptomyces sp. NPDC059083]|uniref:hypothetical protein n=1 Tax=Streptomyces sp. NPDC059083 TaxID=3346721 RepID=UPI003699020A